MPQAQEQAPAVPPTRESVIGSGIAWLSRWSLHWVLIAAGLVVLGWVVQLLWSILLPILLALILTTVLQPLTLVLERRLRLPSALAALASIIGFLVVIATIVAVVSPSVGTEVVDLADRASRGLTRIEQWVQQSRFQVTQEQVEEIVAAAQERLSSSATSIASGVLVGVGAITSALINVILTLVLCFFFLKDGRRFLPWLRGLSGLRVGGHLAEVGSRAWTTLSGFVRTQALVGLIDAVLIGTGLVLLDVPLALPLAVLTFVAAFAPIVGAVAIGVLAVLVALVGNGWVTALIVAGIVLAVQQLEGNLFLPWLQGKSLDLHAGVVLLTVVLGSTLFGVAGAFLGVPAVAVAGVVLRYLNEFVMVRTAGELGPEPDPLPEGREGPEPAGS